MFDIKSYLKNMICSPQGVLVKMVRISETSLEFRISISFIVYKDTFVIFDNWLFLSLMPCYLIGASYIMDIIILIQKNLLAAVSIIKRRKIHNLYYHFFNYLHFIILKWVSCKRTLYFVAYLYWLTVNKYLKLMISQGKRTIVVKKEGLSFDYVSCD